jgi:SagB-type dehydrogenase family enzyme
MRTDLRCWLAAAVLLGAPGLTRAAGLPDISLPPARTEGGKPLMEVLKARQSSRAMAPDSLSLQVMSDLLWAADGINRPDARKRTAPSARNWQEVDIYVVLAQGTYRYHPEGHTLEGVAAGDLRQLAGAQPFVAQAPVNLVYVVDTTRMTGSAPGDEQLLYMGADTGFIGQNVYLFCASEGLATVIRGSLDRTGLTAALGLTPQMRIILAQTVGYPARP